MPASCCKGLASRSASSAQCKGSSSFAFSRQNSLSAIGSASVNQTPYMLNMELRNPPNELSFCMNNSFLIHLLMGGILFGTPLLIAALGELIAERSGVLNLGVEGMMLVGAVSGFWASQRLGATGLVSMIIAFVVAGAAGGLMALIHAIASITLQANQIVSGLALAIFGGAFGLSTYIGDAARLAG